MSHTGARRILSVSYDSALLGTREMLLEQAGYQVKSVGDLSDALRECRNGGYDLFILGHSLDYDDKLALLGAFRRRCSAPILALKRVGEKTLPPEVLVVDPASPEEFLVTVEQALAAGSSSVGQPA